MSHMIGKESYKSLEERLNKFPQGTPPSETLYMILSLMFTLFSLVKLITPDGLFISLVFLSLFSFNWSCLSIQSSFLVNFCLQQQCMKIVADNNFR